MDLHNLTDEELVLLLERSLEEDEKRIACQSSLAEFVKFIWPIHRPGEELVWDPHLDKFCDILEALYRGEFQRLIVNVPPRTTKSIVFSVAYPLWVWIQDEPDALKGGPAHEFLTISGKDGLAMDLSRYSRNIIRDERFGALFGNRVQIAKGQDEKSKYEISGGGSRRSFAIHAGMTGQGAHTIIIDDPNDIKDRASSVMLQAVIDDYGGVISRANDPSKVKVVLVQQRTSEGDLTGYLLSSEGHYHPENNPRGWLQFVLPMEFELDEEDRKVNPAGEFGYTDWRTEPGELLCPNRVPPDVLEFLAEKQYGGRDSFEYTGQFQQRPAPKEGGIIKKHWWRRWPADKELPYCHHIFLSWDTAFSEKESKKAAYSAMTAWGIFQHPDHEGLNAILCLGLWYDRAAYPELKEKMREREKFFEADAHLIEKAASGHSLLQDLTRTHTDTGRRVLLRSMRPRELGDKETRAHVTAGSFHAGLVYVPSPAHANSPQVIKDDIAWVNKLINFVAVFPNGAPPSADITDTVTQAIIYLQRMWWVNHPDDEAGMNYVGAKEADEDPYTDLFEPGNKPVVRYGYG